ncbi:MAG: hypothetical protein R6U17_09430, partial [Thermoplasmata archaeon]
DQGFGRSMLDRSLYFDGDDRKAYVFDSWNEDVELSTGQSWDMDFEVNDPSQELEVTLVWSDYPGAPEADPTIVNDLDLELFTPGGTRYVGNAYTGYDPGYSEPDPTSNPWNGPRSGAWDGLNVEENILLLPSENGVDTGTYQVSVSAHQVAQGTQPFAVVISGGIGVDVEPSPSIELTSPTGGEVWTSGTTESITWTTTPANGTITGVDLEFSSDGGSSWEYIVEGTEDSGSYSWSIPDVLTLDAMVRTTVHDDEGMNSSDVSGVFSILGDPPTPPTNLNVELTGVSDILDNGIFDGNYDPWNLTRVVEQGEARWDNESYIEGGSIYVSTEAAEEGNITTEMSYWEQSIEPTSEELTVSGTYRKLITVDSGIGWATYVHNATVEILVNDTAIGWQSVLIDEDISSGDSGWVEFEPVVYAPTGSVDNVRVLMHVTAEGDTGPLGGAQSAMGELWVDQVSVAEADEDATEDNFITWDASSDDPTNITHYDIFRADNEDGVRWGELLATVDADGSASYSYTDYGAGTADEILWWYVVNAVNEYGQTDGNEGAVQEPSGPSPSIELTRPTGGETWDAGTTESITWTTTPGDYNITVVDLEFSTDGGTSWDYIIEGTTDTGSFDWDIPGDIYSSSVRVRATVHDDEGLSGIDTSGLFMILGDLPAPPSNLTVEHSGTAELLENGIFDEDYEPWELTRVEDEGLAEWSNQSYLEGGSIYVYAQAQGEGNVSTENSYWEQSFEPTSSGVMISGAFRKALSAGSGLGWTTYIHNATVEILVHDTDVGWQSVFMDNDTTTGTFDWEEFEPVVYNPVGYVHTIRARMHVTAEGDTGPMGGEQEAVGELWMDNMSVIAMDSSDATEDNLITWDASPDDPLRVSHYNILRADNEDGIRWGELLATVDADGSASYSYTDHGAGTADGVLWWYVVQAIDYHNRSDGNEDAVREPVEADAPNFHVEITSYDEEVVEGETVTVEYTITNTGTLEGTQDIVFSVGSTQEDMYTNLTLGVGNTFDDSFTWDSVDPGTYSLMVSSDDDIDLVMVDVVEETYTLTIDSTHGGEVTAPGEGSFVYGVDTVVDLVASADEYYDFIEWTGDIGNISDPLSAETNITVKEDCTITAVFETNLEEYELTIDVDGAGTTDPVPGTYIYLEGTDVTITATPSPDWEFVEWTGDATGTDLSITITMDDNKTVTAVFEETVTYTLTVNTDGDGTVDVEPDQPEYEEGTVVALTANPAFGWEFIEWTGDATGTSISTDVTMDDDKIVTAVFAEIPTQTYTLTWHIEGEGIVDVDSEETVYEEGTNVTLTATPAQGWKFMEWTDGASGTDRTLTITMEDDINVTAIFERDEGKPSESGFIEDYWWVPILLIIVALIIVVVVSSSGKEEPEEIDDISEEEYLEEDHEDVDMT